MTPEPVYVDVLFEVVADMLLRVAVWGVGIGAIVFALVMIVPVIRLVAWGDRI